MNLGLEILLKMNGANDSDITAIDGAILPAERLDMAMTELEPIIEKIWPEIMKALPIIQKNYPDAKSVLPVARRILQLLKGT